MSEITFGPSLVVPTAPANPPRRLGADHGPLGVGGAYCGCQRAGYLGFMSFENYELLKLPDLKNMYLEKEPDNA